MIVIDMVYFGFVCLLKLILYSSKPIIKCVTEMFLFCFTKILNQAFLHDSHIWLWGFFTFLVALAHGAAVHSCTKRQKPAEKSDFDKFVKSTNHTYTCNDLTNFEYVVAPETEAILNLHWKLVKPPWMNLFLAGFSLLEPAVR